MYKVFLYTPHLVSPNINVLLITDSQWSKAGNSHWHDTTNWSINFIQMFPIIHSMSFSWSWILSRFPRCILLSCSLSILQCLKKYLMSGCIKTENILFLIILLATNFNIHRLFLSEAMNTVFPKCWFFYFYRSFFIHQTDFSCKKQLSLFFSLLMYLFICMIWTRGYLFYMHYSPLLSLFILFHKLSQVCYGLFRWFNSQISALLKINPLQEMPVWRCGIGGKMKMYRWRSKNARGMKDKGYWTQILAVPRMKDKRLMDTEAQGSNYPWLLYCGWRSDRLAIGKKV